MFMAIRNGRRRRSAGGGGSRPPEMGKEDWIALGVFILVLFTFGMVGALVNSQRGDDPADAGQPDVTPYWPLP